MSGVVCIVGDSYVHRLEAYAWSIGCPNMNFESGWSVRYLGVGGARVHSPNPQRRVIRQINTAIQEPNLRWVYLNIGSNDLCNPQTVPETLAQHIFSLAVFITHANPWVKVTIGQIHKRLVTPFQVYNNHVDATNQALRHLCIMGDGSLINPRIDWAFVRGLCRPGPADYSDGIHFSEGGNYKFFKGVRGSAVRLLEL